MPLPPSQHSVELVDQTPPPPPALVHKRIAASAVVPRALQIPCDDHRVAAGEPCWPTASAVCMPRIRRAGLTNDPWHAPSRGALYRPFAHGHATGVSIYSERTR